MINTETGTVNTADETAKQKKEGIAALFEPIPQSSFMPLTQHLLTIAVFITVLGLDRMTKWFLLQWHTAWTTGRQLFAFTPIVYKFLQNFKIPVLPNNILNFIFSRNTGWVFGIGTGLDPAFRVPISLFFSLIAILFIVYIYLITQKHILHKITFGMILGGAIGNCIDRVAFPLQGVIDFIDMPWLHGTRFATYNIADSGIVVGVLLLIIILWIEEYKEKKKEHVALSGIQKDL